MFICACAANVTRENRVKATSLSCGVSSARLSLYSSHLLSISKLDSKQPY